ncbi:MAG: 30S ribosomal protein S6 [Deltaproteobacteria bacterium CG_4_10_14_0_2_um_filter_43_8]|nr:MAG: 30S ribosomal protein S6 [Deltaproteobacteria bacterium CG11_big_fil_rev_8_21_14_0_20_42_23]PJA21068.1 MAG: 30S ribosomal protein S6 [Deltaproteobacteria bacterium CG_4_10_14_0_2_um_filter_43_8]PJC64701.1 MAG: 30S ribosomal protein S6 [Deltaproteobacteria bacterium CG_4_9_14_0_2_um_filter_42_21]
MTREYETVVIYHPSQTEVQVAGMNDKLSKIIQKNGGHLFFARNMGRRKLAYPIQNEKLGIYFCFDYAAAGKTVSELERAMKLDESVIRFLTVTKSETVDIEARKAEVEARGEGKPVVAEERPAAPAQSPAPTADKAS